MIELGELIGLGKRAATYTGWRVYWRRDKEGNRTAVAFDAPRKQDARIKSKDLSRKTMFRTMAEAKGSPAIDYEDVFLMVKP